MVYIVVAIAWCLLASIALAMCRLAAFSDEAHAVELSKLTARDALRVRKQAPAETVADDDAFDDQAEAWRATG